MAERLNLQGLLNGSREANPFAGLLDDVLAPGAIYGGFQGDRRQAVRTDAMQALTEGNNRLGLTAWEDLFDANTGQVTDVGALLRSLNAGETLQQRPMSQWGFQQKYGTTAGNVYAGLGANINGPAYYGGTQQQGGGHYGLAAGGNQSGPASGADQYGLATWLSGLGQDSPYSEKSIAFAPEFRFQGPELDGINLQGATLNDLDAWAQQNYGVDALTLAASSNDLLDTRQKWTADPSLWFDPNDPSVIQATMVPGLLPEDSALRLAGYSDAYNRTLEQDRLHADRGFQGTLDRAVMGDSELGRSAFGQYLTQVLGPSRGYEAPLAQPQDTSFLYQQAVFPEMMQLALAQAGLQF